MNSVVILLAEGLVAVLLVATIATCIGLHRRIARLKADESTMRQTIGELVVATETAERAIAGLRNTLSECDRTLGERLRTAERYAADLARQVEAGEEVIERVARIVSATQLIAPEGRQANVNQPTPSAPAAATPGDRLSRASDMAQGLVERAVRRLEGRAA